MKFSVILVLVFLVTEMGFSQGLLDKTIATVKFTKTEQISVKKFESQVDLFQKAAKTSLKADDKKKMLDLMIDDLLFAQAAEKELITVANTEIDNALAQKRKQYGFTSDDQLKQAIVSSGQTWEGYRTLVSGQILKEKYLRAKRPKAFAEQVVTESEIQKVYNAKIGSFAMPPMMQFDQIYVRTSGLKSDEIASLKSKLETIAKDIKSRGESGFKDYYSKALIDKDYFASSDVLINEANFAKAYGENFIDSVFKMKKDQISSVLTSTQGLHIIMVRSYEDQRLIKLDDIIPMQKITAREQIKNALLTQKQYEAIEKARQDLSDEIRKQSDVKIDPKYVWKDS